MRVNSKIRTRLDNELFIFSLKGHNICEIIRFKAIKKMNISWMKAIQVWDIVYEGITIGRWYLNLM